MSIIEQIEDAIHVHCTWVNRLKNAIETGSSELNVDTAECDTTCAFGKWYQGQGVEMCGRSTHFHEIDAPHAEVHALGKQVIAAFNSGDTAGAAAFAERMTARSGELIGIIERLEVEFTVE